MSNTQLNNANKLYSYLILLAFTIPNIVWITLDQRVWPWDQAWYGQVSVELFYRLIHSRSGWFQEMLSAFGTKAPGTAWLGQFFVPLGQMIGSIDTGLLLSIVATQFILWLLIYHTILKLTDSRLISIICCTFAASAPLSVALTHQYFVEPLQTLSVAWVILIMAFAPKWESKTIFLNLISATSLGMLAKITFPLYAFIPILVDTYYIYRNKRISKNRDQADKKRVFSLVSYITPILLVSGFLLWYAKNLQSIVSFSILASSGEASLLYGGKADFLYKIQYWLSASQKSFFAPASLVFLLMLLIYFLIKSFYDFMNKINHIKLDYFDVINVVAITEISLILITFSFQVNQENRYLLPLLPYLALLIAWILKRTRQKLLVFFAGFALVLQLFVVQSQALGVTPEDPNLSSWLYPIDRSSTNKQILSKLVDTTCKNETEKDRYNIIGLELPWFNANSAAYFSAQQQLKKDFRCYYTSLGYAEKDTEKAWARLFDLNINYFATLKPRSQAEAANPLNLVSLPILERIQSSPKFTREIFVDDQSHVLLYKKINP
jgi:hypothetical protein